VAQAEILFSTAKLDIVFLSPDTAGEADKAILGSPTFHQAEYESPPAAGFVADLLEAPPPPGLSKSAVFPLGLKEKGKADFIGLAHLILGYPTETTVFLGLLVIAESHQKKGFGKDFIEGLYNWARPQGITFIRARVHPRHKGGTAFFDKIGFADLPNKLSTGHAVWERRLPAVEE
jgi:GNAT superfamily N-acetyltransferase